MGTHNLTDPTSDRNPPKLSRCKHGFWQRRVPVLPETPSSPRRTRPHLNPLLRNAVLGVLLAMAQGHASAALPEGSSFEVLGPDIQNLSWTPGVAPKASDAELADVSAPRAGYIRVPGISTAFDSTFDQLNCIYDKTGLQIGTFYSMLFQGLTAGTGINGEPWNRYGGAGRWDILGRWVLVGRHGDNPNTGQLVFNADDRFAIGDRPPAPLGTQIATFQSTANTFTDRGWAFRDLFYEQRVWQGQLRFMFGRADSTDYFGSTWMQSAQNSFVNRMFAAGPTVAAPGHGPAVGTSFRPKDSDFYISGGAANAYGDTTEIGLNTLDHWTFFSYGEAGWTPTFNCLGEGRYTVSGWHMAERTETGLPEDWGITVVADQELSKMVQAFARYGYSEAATLRIHQYWQAGMGVRGLIGSTNDMTGLAFSWAYPRGDVLQQEKVVEGFYRLQLTRFMQVSVGAQAIIDPGESTADVVGAFWGRVRILF